MPILETVSTKLRRIGKLAREAPERAFVSLGHNLDMDWMKEAYRRTRKDGAVGVDGQTARKYEQNLEENLQGLLDRVKTGTYRAPPVRRAYIPKGDGKQQRPIGIPTLEDKVLQRAVAMVLEAVYEQDFLPCSYGFRPERSAHQALQALRGQLMAMGGGTVIEVDLERFFDCATQATDCQPVRVGAGAGTAAAAVHPAVEPERQALRVDQTVLRQSPGQGGAELAVLPSLSIALSKHLFCRRGE